MSHDIHARGLRQYSIDTLLLILRDIRKNPISQNKGTPEYGRREAIKNEIQRRGKETS